MGCSQESEDTSSSKKQGDASSGVEDSQGSQGDGSVSDGNPTDSGMDTEGDILVDTSIDLPDDTAFDQSIDGVTDVLDAEETGESSSCKSHPPEVLPYDPKHFSLNQPLGSAVTLDPRSDAVVERLALNTTLRAVGLGTHGESPSVYEVSDSDPLYTVHVSSVPTPELFRVPAGAVQGGGSDSPSELLDRNHPAYGPFVELRLWQAVFDHTKQTITASGGGLFHYNSDGKLLNPDGSPSVGTPFKGWGTGSGLSYLAGLIRPEEVIAGEICHALRFSYSNCHFTDTFRPPATKTDQPKGCPLSLAERGDPASWMEMGMRLQLDPAVDCETRTVPKRNASHDVTEETRMLRMICRALQRYGMVALDGTVPGGLLIYAEDTSTAAWDTILGPPDVHARYSFMLRDQHSATDGFQRDEHSGIPWHRLRVVVP
ncbi:MAG TPA: hypothetical protein PKL73_07600 [Polyangiaceae bacterium]|nr:hypothetical protein [Polyangiaceae bacterium]HNZ23306.1 hypothetical protein [Polyangiaceae bacterium]HOD21924.1 hypothetical protein [Polyangiaceae bacterium]HOE49369.1 hypothetical protein [Polyangiaceae bacterium]HOH00956.1 hypothetical protein [Polyangiaceae bacterium]